MLKSKEFDKPDAIPTSLNTLLAYIGKSYGYPWKFSKHGLIHPASFTPSRLSRTSFTLSLGTSLGD